MKLSLSLGSFVASRVFSLVILIALPTVCQAQPQSIANAPGTVSLGEYSLAQRGLDFKVWQGYTYWTDELGEVITNNQTYTEIATGMSYYSDAGQLIDSVQEIDAVAGGFQATQGRHQVQFTANANAQNGSGAVTLTMPDNSQMVSTVYGLAYWDQSSGSNVLIAPLQDSMGALAASNELIYPNAFQGVMADLQYVYRIGGLSQNVLIKSLPSPAAYGLIPESTVLQVITTFLSTPEPDKTTVNRNGENFDDVLNFGPMFISMGQAILLQGNGASQPAGVVGKHWLRTNQTDYLIEELPYSAVSNMSPPQASNIRPGFGPVWRTASLKPLKPGGRVSRQAQITPPPRVPHSRVIDTALAARLSRERYVLVDYDIVSGTTNITFQGDTTYYISAPVTLVGTNTFEGGTVIKYATNASISMSYASTNVVNWLTSAYLPVMMTAKDNDNIGATLTNSTHSPVGYYANPALSFNLISPAITNFNIQYAKVGIFVNADINFTDGQIVNSSNGVSASSGIVNLDNILFANTPTALVDTMTTSQVQWNAINTTFGGSTSAAAVLLYCNFGGTGIGTLTNCILANLSQFVSEASSGFTNGYNGFYSNAQASTGSIHFTNSSNPFQTVGAGGYYLAPGCNFLNVGTTAIRPAVLADIQGKTVFGPITNYIDTAITTNSTALFSPQVQRDDGPKPSLGYHYAPIDYACSLSLNLSALTINPGTVVAGVYTNGIRINTSTLHCAGNATNMVYLTRYTTVQEQSNTNWQGSWEAFFVPNTTNDALEAQFTVITGLNTEEFFFASYSCSNVAPFYFQNCQIYNAPFYTQSASPSFTNCLFRRPYFIITDHNVSEHNQFYNNLFYYGQVTNYHSIATTWNYNDNLFDHTVITNGDLAPTEANNAYVTNLSMLTATKGSHDVILPASPNYEQGPLGAFYYPTNYYPTSGTNLIYAGSRLASAAGLSLYTVTTNDAPDYTNNVSIGFHYSTPYATPPYITQQPTNTIATYSNSTTFTVTAADGGAPLSYQWQFDGVNITGATSTSYTIPNVTGPNLGTYTVTITDGYTPTTSSNATLHILPTYVVGWGDDTIQQLLIPTNVNSSIMLAAGQDFCLALRSNGTVVAWGDNTYGNTSVPSNLANVVSIAVGPIHSLALLSNGTVTNWGSYTDHTAISNVTDYPILSSVTNVIAIAAGACQDAALRSDGTVVVWGQTDHQSDSTNVQLISYYPALWPLTTSANTNIKAIACGFSNNVGLLTSGSLIAWGNTNQLGIPAGLTNVAAISAYGNEYLALLSNGIVLQWGKTNAPVPTTLTNAASIVQGNGVALAITSNGTVVAWGNDVTEIQVPAGLSNVVAAAAGGDDAFALAGGAVLLPRILSAAPSSPIWAMTNTTLSVLATNTFPANYPIGYRWFLNGSPIYTNGSLVTSTNLSVAPTGSLYVSDEGTYKVVITNQAGAVCATWTVRVALPGMAAAWGDDTYGECDPPPLTNFLAVAAGEYHSLGLLDNGTVTNWGEYWNGSNFIPSIRPTNNSSFSAIAAGLQHDVGLLTNGTVATWGLLTAPANFLPTNTITNAFAVACGWDHNVALLSNGTVQTWGFNLPYADVLDVPSYVSNVTSISAASLHSLALMSNGTVAAWGYGPSGEASVPEALTNGMTNIVAIAAGDQHNLALTSNGLVVAWGYNGSQQCDVPIGLSNVMAISAGAAHSVALQNDGTVVCWGDTNYLETAVPSAITNGIARTISAGGYHTLEAVYSTVLQYPVNVSRDVLLIYNTNSMDSYNMCMYYKSNRPMMSSATVLGINPSVADDIGYDAFVTNIQGPIQTWLSNNPTMRPDYVILFQDIPYKVTNYLASVQYYLHYATEPGWRPHVTSINMNGPVEDPTNFFTDGTVDCSNYIYKVISMASTNHPGTLFISGSAAGYTQNNKWYFDEAGDTTGLNGYAPYANAAVQGVTNALPTAQIVATNGIFFTFYTTNEITNVVTNICWNFTRTGSNVAGYFTIGFDNPFTNVNLSHDMFISTNMVQFTGASGWYVMATIDSYNGDRPNVQADFPSWFSSNSLGGANYSNTPVGGITTVDEPFIPGHADAQAYYGDWAAGRPFGIAAWHAEEVTVSTQVGGDPQFFQAVGDPFVKR